MFGIGNEALSDVREWSIGPPVCTSGVVSTSRVVERPSPMSGSGRESLPYV